MVSKRNLDLAANVTIELFGNDAQLRAASKAKEKRDSGDKEGEKFWLQIEQIIVERAKKRKE